MIMSPSILSSKTGDEKVAIYLQLDTGIAPATIVGTPVWSSNPTGLTFSGSTTLDSARTAAVFAAGGADGVDYTISALCVLSTGEIVEPVVALPVVADQSETTLRRAIVL